MLFLDSDSKSRLIREASQKARSHSYLKDLDFFNKNDPKVIVSQSKISSLDCDSISNKGGRGRRCKSRRIRDGGGQRFDEKKEILSEEIPPWSDCGAQQAAEPEIEGQVEEIRAPEFVWVVRDFELGEYQQM